MMTYRRTIGRQSHGRRQVWRVPARRLRQNAAEENTLEIRKLEELYSR